MSVVPIIIELQRKEEMPIYQIKAQYEYWAEDIEAENEAEAEKIFLNDLNQYYYGTYEFDIEEVEQEEDE
jgi:hypothetical protein